ncbi:MAG: cytochrome c oxidase subunit 3 family protein [Candidatus Riflebacteria bacterium]|nr:cytochrome c oxidase subunit 3 family protein [Candidatus Riflebacteria bacterium]
MHKDSTGSRMGMWIFLFTELILFGGLFLLYAIYSNRYPQEFSDAAKNLSLLLGSVNTVVLLTSSLFVVLSIINLRSNSKRDALMYLIGTIVCALIFLMIKGVEWHGKFEHGLFPNSLVMQNKPKGEMIFFSLYFLLTGLHAVHVLIGAFLLSIMAWWIHTGKLTEENDIFLENSGLYWHLVDLIWIYIFPLFYVVVP